MKIATWNVNSVKARMDRLHAFLARHSPDIVCLQELKLDAAAFPHMELVASGYHAVVHGQKSYNGVAILARVEPGEIALGLSDGEPDPHARAITATVAGLRVMSLYVPNGGEPGSEKWIYKLAWLDRLIAHLQATHRPSDALVLCGDLNIAPDDLDVARPEEWASTAACLPEVRERFGKLLALGLVDCVRKHHPAGGLYSWWDYRMLGFPKNNGLRIDHLLASESVAARCTAAYVDRQERKGKLPSDHAPVIIELD
jgi:exodeoxyribonuclease-3